jgi:hypothetical protein
MGIKEVIGAAIITKVVFIENHHYSNKEILTLP